MPDVDFGILLFVIEYEEQGCVLEVWDLGS